MVQESDRPTDTNTEQPTSQSAGDGAAAQVAEGQEIESLRQEVESLKGKYLRALADCQNLQKRAASERSEAIQRSQAEMARALLPVLDDFERTLEAARSNQEALVFAKGVQIIHEQMLKVLSEFGVKRMDVGKGSPFDPVYHQAVAQQPSDQIEPGHILHVAQAGYTIHDRILRPATVVVATRALPGSSEEGA